MEAGVKQSGCVRDGTWVLFRQADRMMHALRQPSCWDGKQLTKDSCKQYFVQHGTCFPEAIRPQLEISVRVVWDVPVQCCTYIRRKKSGPKLECQGSVPGYPEERKKK